jgi:hypothetical protein
MSVEMAIWRMTETGPKRVGFAALRLEQQLEDMIVEDPSLVGLDLLIVGRQVPTTYGGLIDVLGVDEDARVHVLELKRDRTPRGVVAQALDYGSWAQDVALEDISERYAEAYDEPFDEAFANRFGKPLPDVFNPDQQLTIVASELDPASDRIVEYLAENYGVPINAVFFRHFHDEDRHYLARTWLLAPEEAAAAKGRTTRRGKVRPWNGRDFYVVLGNLEQGHRWHFATDYGLLSAGGGTWYWKPLRNLTPGKRVFAYVGGAGYVGVGTVTGEAIPAREATVEVDGREAPLLSQPDVPDWLVERGQSEDPEVTEYVVPIRWLEARPVDKAITERGLFASQVTACKLRDERTIELLEQAFGLDGDDS